MLEKQEQAAEKLLYILPSYFAKLVRDPNVDKADIPDLAALVAILRQEDSLPTDFLQYRNMFKKYANFNNFDTKNLIHMANFMSISPVTGFNTINNIIKWGGKQIQVDGPIAGHIAKRIVARELNMLFRQLRKEDLLLGFENLDAFSDRELDKICFRRGINIHDQNRKQKMEDLKLWLSISNQRNIPHSLLLLIRVNDFSFNQFKIDENETQDEILRRVSCINRCYALPSPKMMPITLNL